MLTERENLSQSGGAVPLLDEADRRELLIDWNNTHKDYPTHQLLHQLFEAQAEKTPQAIALSFEDSQFTYCELNLRANQLAHHLIALGVGPGVLVAICVERSIEMVIGLLGILKAGGAYLPLDPEYPRERLAFMLEDARTPVVLTQQRLLADLPQHGAKQVLLDDVADSFGSYPATAPDVAVVPDNLAYVIYTSGSTGRPKGVCIPHRALVNFLHAMREQTKMAGQDALLAVTTLAFDIAALELWLPLTTGARTILLSREDASDGVQLIKQLTDRGITFMQATPATWQLLLESGWTGSDRLHVLCGGEALARSLADQLLVRCASLTNVYGPTESTVWSTAHRVVADGRAVPIGRPIANTQTYILDPDLNPVPIGVAGELHIGGAGLARGYLNRPELTAEKFIAHPFAENARLYKTGDLARYLPDGNIEFLGRLDHQVKIRGHRIELGEIEAALNARSGVQQCVVVAREDHPGLKRLVAYVVGAAADADELKRQLSEILPQYMVPAAFVVLPHLPTSPSGKIDRKALPAPFEPAASYDPTLTAPRTEEELAIAEIWQRLLGIRQVSVTDNFFDLGGHSLLAMRAVVEIEKRLGVRLHVRRLIFDSLGVIAAIDSAPAAEIRESGPKRGLFARLASAFRPGAS